MKTITYLERSGTLPCYFTMTDKFFHEYYYFFLQFWIYCHNYSLRFLCQNKFI